MTGMWMRYGITPDHCMHLPQSGPVRQGKMYMLRKPESLHLGRQEDGRGSKALQQIVQPVSEP